MCAGGDAWGFGGVDRYGGGIDLAGGHNCSGRGCALATEDSGVGPGNGAVADDGVEDGVWPWPEQIFIRLWRCREP